MEKQERAYVAWLNHWLTTEGEQLCAEGEQAGTLAARRLVATMRGSIWQQCRNSPELADVIYKIEKRVDEGRMRFRDVRRCGVPDGVCGCPGLTTLLLPAGCHARRAGGGRGHQGPAQLPPCMAAART
jgi:hypothetical protein